jgi:hypothetical protein
MKTIQIFTLLLLIIYITCICKGDVSSSDATVDKCKSDNIGDGYCCYVEAPKSDPSKKCVPLTKYQYDHIKVLAEYNKVFGGNDGKTKDKDAKIKCNSQYLQISLILLILLFL